MAQFLRPDSNITQTDFTGGFADIDETLANLNDNDFAYGANNTIATLECHLSNPAGTPQSGTCTVRWRYAKTNNGTVDSGGNTVNVTGAIYQGTTLIASSVAQSALGVWQTDLYTFDTSAVTDWTDLRFRFTTSASGGGPAVRRGGAVSWAELEIPDPLPPDVTASGSVGTVNTTVLSANTSEAYIDAPVVKRSFSADGFENSFSYTTGPQTTLMLVLVAYDGTAYASSSVSEDPHLTSISFNGKSLTFQVYAWRDDSGQGYDARTEIYFLRDSPTDQFPAGTGNIVYTPRANSGISGRMTVVTFTADKGAANWSNAGFNSVVGGVGFSVAPVALTSVTSLIGVTQTNRPSSDLTFSHNSVVLDQFEDQEQPSDETTSYVALAPYKTYSRFGHTSGTAHTYAYAYLNVTSSIFKSRQASGDLLSVSSLAPEASVTIGGGNVDVTASAEVGTVSSLAPEASVTIVNNVDVTASAGVSTITASPISGKAPWDEYLAPDGIQEQANISGAIWDIQDDPYNPDAFWHEY